MNKREKDLRRGVVARINLMPIDWYLQTPQGRRASKHIIEGAITDLETNKQITFTGAHKLLEAIYNLQRKKAREYRRGILKSRED